VNKDYYYIKTFHSCLLLITSSSEHRICTSAACRARRAVRVALCYRQAQQLSLRLFPMPKCMGEIACRDVARRTKWNLGLTTQSPLLRVAVFNLANDFQLRHHSKCHRQMLGHQIQPARTLIRRFGHSLRLTDLAFCSFQCTAGTPGHAAYRSINFFLFQALKNHFATGGQGQKIKFLSFKEIR